MISSISRRLTALALLTIVFTALYAAGSRIGSPSWPVSASHLDTFDPLVEAAAVLRLAAMAACIWLALVTLIDAAAQAARAQLVSDMATALAPTAWRNFVLRPVALATLAAPQVLLPMAAVTPVAAHVAADVHIPPDPINTGSGATLEMALYAAPTRTLALTLLEPDPVSQPPSHPTIAPAESRVRVVGAGENLWSIAAAHLGEELGRRPASSEVTPYWHAVINVNRHVLPDPENPDLLYRGIELTMPPVGG